MNFISNTVGTSTASGLLELSLVEPMRIVVIIGKSLNVLLLIFEPSLCGLRHKILLRHEVGLVSKKYLKILQVKIQSDEKPYKP